MGVRGRGFGGRGCIVGTVRMQRVPFAVTLNREISHFCKEKKMKRNALFESKQVLTKNLTTDTHGALDLLKSLKSKV